MCNSVSISVVLTCACVVSLFGLQLPGISGIEAAQQIRAYEKQKGRAPTVMFGLTGNVEEENLQAYEAVGMNGCIMKGTLLGEAVTQALSQLQQNPTGFVNLCRKDADSAHHGDKKKKGKATDA